MWFSLARVVCGFIRVLEGLLIWELDEHVLYCRPLLLYDDLKLHSRTRPWEWPRHGIAGITYSYFYLNSIILGFLIRGHLSETQTRLRPHNFTLFGLYATLHALRHATEY